MKMKRPVALLLAMLFMASLVSAYAEEPYTPTAAEIALGRPASDEPTHVTVGNATKVQGYFFSAQFGNSTTDIDVRNMVHGYNPIAWVSQVEFAADPTVVKSIDKTVNAEGDWVYTISLNQGLVWNDGETPVTAADYVFAMLLLASDEFAALGAENGNFAHIVGYEAYAAGESDTFAGIRLIDSYTYSVTVKQAYEPCFYEMNYLSVDPAPISVIAPGCKVADSSDGAAIVNADETLTTPVFTAELLRKTVMDPKTGYMSHPTFTCGPYNLTGVDLVSGTVEFAINPWYRGNYEGIVPVIDTVTLVLAPTDRQAEMVVNGEVDILNKVVSGDVVNQVIPQMEQNSIRMLSYARLGYGFIAFACEKGPQQSAAVRQAIAYAFDTDTFTRIYLRGYGLTVDGYMGLGQWMYRASSGSLRPADMDDEESALWDELTLDGLNHYAQDLDVAKQLLIDDGWTLNADGEPFTEGVDAIRYKDVDGTLTALSFTFVQSEGSGAAQLVVEMLQDPFLALGAELKVVVMPFDEMLDDYYRADGGRVMDMCFLATNFVSTFDPYASFAPGSEYDGTMNTSGISDPELTALAWAMHVTESGDSLGFMRAWIAFQQRFNEVLPNMPIYSNVYFDFYSSSIHNYYANAEIGWPAALLYSYVDDSDVMPEQEAPMEEEIDDDDIFID